MKIENYEANNLPVDVINSIKKLELIVNTIEDKLFIPKEDILREIVIIMGDLQVARKIFSLYYPIEGISLSSYIVQRKKTEAIKAISSMKNNQVIDNKIREITGWSRSYFNRVIKENNTMIEAFDVEDLIYNMIAIYDNLHKLNDMNLINTQCKRTKIIIKNRDWNVGLRMIFSMREYISITEEKDLDKLINYDMFLKNYEWIDEYTKLNDEYNPFSVIDYYSKIQHELNDEKEDRIMDFFMYYEQNKAFKVGDITYYCADREKFRQVMDEFILPENLFEYRTIIYKTKLSLRIMGRRDVEVEYYINKFKSFLENETEKFVFSYFIENEENSMDGKLENIYQDLHYRSREDINNAIKNLIIKGYISLKLSPM